MKRRFKQLINFRLKSKKTVLVSIVVFLVLFITFTSTGQAFYKSILVLSEQIPANPIRPIGFLTASPNKEVVEVNDSGRKIKVEILRPQKGKNNPLIIVSPGAGLGFSEEALERLANSLARVGVEVAFPEIPEMVDLGKNGEYDTVRAATSLVNVYKYFETRSEINKKKMGFMGFCVGASVGLVAAENPDINQRVGFVNAFQPYYGISMLTVLDNVATKPQGGFIPFSPNIQTLTVMRQMRIGPLPDKNDRAILTKVFIDKTGSNNLESYNQLTAKGKKVFDLLINEKPEEMNKFFDQLPTEVKSFAQESSPYYKIKDLKAKVFVFSSDLDSFIPATESDFLISSLPSSQVESARLKSLTHLEPNTRFKLFQDLGEYWKILNYIYANLNFLFSHA